jgi:hypothetical protein
MGVVYIGDRGTGKTHLAMELANPLSELVKVSSPEYEFLKSFLYDDSFEGTKATDANKEVDARQLDIQVRLPTGIKQISVDWIDTPGEIWRKRWQADNPDKWKNFLDTAHQSEGILLILPPYRNILKPGVDSRQFITQQQWCNRFKGWVEFFSNNCYKARQLVICLNKADLFCDIEKESSILAHKNWHQRHIYVLQRYLNPIQPQIEQMNRSMDSSSVSCFITSIYKRKLLELPWIYMGTFLSQQVRFKAK